MQIFKNVDQKEAGVPSRQWIKINRMESGGCFVYFLSAYWLFVSVWNHSDLKKCLTEQYRFRGEPQRHCSHLWQSGIAEGSTNICCLCKHIGKCCLLF